MNCQLYFHSDVQAGFHPTLFFNDPLPPPPPPHPHECASPISLSILVLPALPLHPPPLSLFSCKTNFYRQLILAAATFPSQSQSWRRVFPVGVLGQTPGIKAAAAITANAPHEQTPATQRYRGHRSAIIIIYFVGRKWTQRSPAKSYHSNAQRTGRAELSALSADISALAVWKWGGSCHMGDGEGAQMADTVSSSFANVQSCQ